ncbi:unnamed protein product [Arabidopsis thaliana]|uniref:Uncharacterized protein n=1 Tax=Arabidopsis thaliana TaxID=3702 RepID=A0A654G9D9_ARATH|nr:unnamed protein product [Arabidopsis thaliana]
MYKCEDQMFEVDILMGALTSVVERAEEVIKGEMKPKDLGGKFYKCVEMLYGGDMFEIVTKDHQRVLHVIVSQLKQKLRHVTAARENLKSVWKQIIEKFSTKQRGPTAQESQLNVDKYRLCRF